MKFVLVLLMSFSPLIALAGEKEAEAYDVLNKYCMVATDQPGTMTTLLRINDAQKLGKDEAMAKFGVRAELWVVTGKSSEYAVYSLRPGTCGVLHKNLDFNRVTTAAKKKLKRKVKIQEDDTVSVSTFRVTLTKRLKKPTKREKKRPAVFAKLVLEISTSKMAVNKNTTYLMVISEPLYKKLTKEVKPLALCTAAESDVATCG